MSSTIALPKPERTIIGGSLEIPRLISGLWQLAGGHDKQIDISSAAKMIEKLIEAGCDSFDMADHYGPAELVIGEYNKNSKKAITAFTKWCPSEPDITTFQQAEAAVDLARRRMNQDQIALMQYHVWDYSDESYIHNLDHLRTMQKQGKIAHIGLTNTDAAHLELLIDSGFNIATNQVSCSVIDQRVARGRLSSVCASHGVGILAYGTLLGGYLSEKWVGVPEPQDLESLNWSLRKYLRFIHAAGGWEPFQGVLQALSTIARKHGVPIAAVATRYVLDLPVVSAVIVGTRLSAGTDKYTSALNPIPGDCGDEYRRAPYLTAKGDLSDHLKTSASDTKLAKALAAGSRIEFSSGSKWEPIAGYCRAVRTSNTIRISGTTANSPIPSIAVLGGSSARSQTIAILDIIARAVKALGGSLSNVVRTRIMVQNDKDAGEVGRAHGWVFGCVGIRPSNTLVISGLIGAEFLVEIEAEAVVGSGDVVQI